LAVKGIIRFLLNFFNKGVIMIDQGWITIHRKIKDSPFYKDSEAIHLWIHILLSANHKNNKFLIGNKMIDIPRGCILTGRKSLSAQTGINESKIQRLLKLFESEQQIEQQTFSKYRLISIVNYDSYQKDEQQKNSKRTASEQQVNTNNNVNNENNVNKQQKKKAVVFELPNNIDEITWKSFLEHRQKLKAPMTDHAKNLMMKKLEKLNGNPNHILNQSIENGWKGVFELKQENNNGNNQPDNRSRAKKHQDKLREIAERDIKQHGNPDLMG